MDIPSNEIWVELIDNYNVICPTSISHDNCCIAVVKHGKFVIMRFAKPVTRIQYRMFEEQTRIKRVILPNSVTSIDEEGFSFCTALGEIRLPEILKTIGTDAFKSCLNLKRITLPNSVTSIGWSAFFHCFDLKEVRLNNKIAHISPQAFLGCSNLTHIYYEGTMAQWKAIPKGENWNDGVNIYCRIHCTDGVIPFENT